MSVIIDNGIHCTDQSGCRGKLVQKLYNLVLVRHGKIKTADAAGLQTIDSCRKSLFIYLKA